MAFPAALDSLTNPLSTDLLTSPAHHTQHANANDAIEFLEAKVGIDGSAVTTSHDYKLSGVTGTDKAVSKTGSEILTNKTLTAPNINMGSDATGDIYYRTSGGLFARLPIGIAGYILDVSSGLIPEWIPNPAAADSSTTVKGVVEEATLAEVLARTASGGAGRLVVNPSNVPGLLTYDYAASSAGSDTYAITPSGTAAPTAYVTGQVFRFKADVANTGAATLNVNSLGAKSILRVNGSALADGDISANQIVEVIYDGTNMRILSSLANMPKFTQGVSSRDMTAVSGAVTIAHGLGRIPRKIKITSMFANGSGSHASPFPHVCVGVYDGSTTATVYFSDVGSTDWQAATDTSNIIYLNQGTGTGAQAASATFDATDITLTWTKTNSPTGTSYFMWEAEA